MASTPSAIEPAEENGVLPTPAIKRALLIVTIFFILFSLTQAAREVGPDLNRGLMLPADQEVYAAVDLSDSWNELMTQLSLVVPWAAAVVDKIQDMQIRTRDVTQVEVRATKAEEELARVQKELEVSVMQASSLAKDKRNMEGDLTKLRDRLDRRTVELKTSRKQLRKEKKKLVLTEERCFQMGFDEAVTRAHGQGWDHKLLLDEGMEDPVDRTDVDEAIIVSSGPDEDISN